MDGDCWWCQFYSYSIVNCPVISLAQKTAVLPMHSSQLSPLTDQVYPPGSSHCSPCKGCCRLCPVVLPISFKDLLEERCKGSWPYRMHVASPAQKWQLPPLIQIVVSVATVTAVSPDKLANCIWGAHCSPSLGQRETTHMTSFPFDRLTGQKWFEPV